MSKTAMTALIRSFFTTGSPAPSAVTKMCIRDRSPLGDLHQPVHQILVLAGNAADAGTACGEPLGNGIHYDHTVSQIIQHAEGYGFAIVIGEFPVHFVSDDPQVVFLGDCLLYTSRCV